MPQPKTKATFTLTAADRKRASTRGQAARKAVYYIDGQPCAAEDVMARTGWTKDQVVATIRRERDNKRTPLSWARIDEIAARRRGEG